MVQQVDLKAPDIDVADTAGLQCADLLQGGLLAVGHVRLAAGVDGPGRRDDAPQ
jgi:hypothetical protein